MTSAFTQAATKNRPAYGEFTKAVNAIQSLFDGMNKEIDYAAFAAAQPTHAATVARAFSGSSLANVHETNRFLGADERGQFAPKPVYGDNGVAGYSIPLLGVPNHRGRTPVHLSANVLKTADGIIGSKFTSTGTHMASFAAQRTYNIFDPDHASEIQAAFGNFFHEIAGEPGAGINKSTLLRFANYPELAVFDLTTALNTATSAPGRGHDIRSGEGIHLRT